MSDITDKVIQAAMTGDLAVLRRIAKQHGVTAVKAEGDPDELTTIHVAAAAGHEDIVRFLLSDEIRADPRTATDNNFTPLHAAAMQGNARICQLLLDHGADPNMQTDPQGYLPLHSAAWGGHVEAVQVLLECGARTDLHNYRGEIPLKTARRQKRTAVVELLKGRMPRKSWWRFW